MSAEINQKDLVLAPNEYAFLCDETKGNVSCNVGPHKMSLSQSDKLVRFDTRYKRFVPCEKYRDAIQLFTTVPEGWYVALKNPAPDNRHPSPGTSNSIPENMQVGYKINIAGPANFALYPGQMADVIKGHSLRSNQYLIARVYDAASLREGKDKEDSEDNSYVNGQILIIKGTEISFYIPPTGIEVIAIDNNPSKGYVRDAVTLERLEYCILKDEDGNKRYVHGPEVVFPAPTESFIQDGNGHIKRNAIELSDISGVYVKVISDYKDEKTGKEYKTGDELFITGKEQMIYYPRPEHTFITYNGRIVHHAIAIPKGEGRYIMNRMTGEIKTVRGPAMYLPDPRVEVSVKRTLNRSQCELWYPGNQEVLKANGYGSTNKDLPDGLGATQVGNFFDQTMVPTNAVNYIGTPTKKEHNKMNRTNTFTPPRTISLNSGKYEGAVGVDVWTGYAVNVISKDGTRETVCGPRTILLDYDQSLETLELSTGKVKTEDYTKKIAFLKYENNQVSDTIYVETSDFVRSAVRLSYVVSFDEADIDKWFAVDNYVKHLCDWARSAISKATKEHTITEWCNGYHEIVTKALTTEDNDATYLHKFDENGMLISAVEITSMAVTDAKIQELIDSHQEKIIKHALELNAAKQSAETEAEILALNREKVKLSEDFVRYQTTTHAESKKLAFDLAIDEQKAKDEEEKRKQEVLKEIQTIKDAIFEAEQERLSKERGAELAHKAALAEIEAKREAQSAEAMKVIIEAIGPELAAAMTTQSNQEILSVIAESISPYAIAEGESVSTAVSKLLHGTTMEHIFDNMKK